MTADDHGSAATYIYHRCRCDLCRAAWAAYKRQWRARQTAEGRPHGKLSTYKNYGCRCEECRAVNAAYYKAWAHR